jgi:hypothetical protein
MSQDKNYAIALSVPKGFIVRFDTHPFYHNQATGLSAELNDESASIIVLVQLRTDKKSSKITFIYADESISISHIESEIEKIEKCDKYILSKNSQNLKELSDFLKISLTENSKELYLQFSDNKEGFKLHLFDSRPENIVYIRHPSYSQIETIGEINKKLLPKDKLQSLSHSRIIYDLNCWMPIVFSCEPVVKMLINKKRKFRNSRVIMNFIQENKIKLQDQADLFKLALYILYYHLDFDYKKLLIQLVEGFLEVLKRNTCKKTKLLIARIKGAIKNPKTVYKEINDIKEIRSPVSQNMSQEYKLIIEYVGSAIHIYEFFAEKDGCEDQASFNRMALVQKRQADFLYEANKHCEANNLYCLALRTFQLLYPCGHNTLLEGNLALVKNLCDILSSHSQYLDYYLEAKMSFDTVVRMKKSLATSDFELVPIYDFILFLFQKITYKGLIDEVKILKLISQQLLETSDEKDNAINVLAYLFNLMLIRSEISSEVLDKIKKLLIQLSVITCGGLLVKFVHAFSFSFLYEFLRVKLLESEDFLPLHCVLANLQMLRKITLGGNLEHSQLIERTPTLLLIVLLKGAKSIWSKSCIDPDIGEKEIVLYIEKHLQVFCELMKKLNKENVILFELYHHLLAVIYQIKQNCSEYIALLKKTINDHLIALEENKQDAIYTLWGHFLYVILNNTPSKVLLSILNSLTPETLKVIVHAMGNYIELNNLTFDVHQLSAFQDQPELCRHIQQYMMQFKFKFEYSADFIKKHSQYLIKESLREVASSLFFFPPSEAKQSKQVNDGYIEQNQSLSFI